MVIIESAGITDVGKKRKGNEDSFLVDDTIQLYIVADGMGGHQSGEVASKLVVDTVENYMNRFNNGNHDVEELADANEELTKDANRLLASIHLANQGVNTISKSKDSYRGMGSTVSAVYFTDDTLIAANVGDSPIYLIHDGKIETLSVPHTVLAEQEAINPEAASKFGPEFRHMLTQGMGIADTVKPDISELQCYKNDIVVISSDGLSDKVSEDEILEIVKQDRPGKVCRKLVDMANERGGDDNTTVIVLKVKQVFDKHGIKGYIFRFIEAIKQFFK